ncbi:MAG: SUF system Fe-S cluster assembly protein [Chloroherpetonaceae bacterium]|nr:SUF system Fe-S cluster assembly protein [Chthonomonadaceae bacterium]MDW8208613.1 SUF system Fe-S cluster assembly protein [Chloroherpetonaceae bacterium]
METPQDVVPSWNPIEVSLKRNEVIEALRTVYDPEIPVNIYDLGLIYDVDVTPEGVACIQMTLTSPACPAAQSLPGEVEWKVRQVAGIADVQVHVVWDPPWSMDRMSEEAKLELGLL